MPQLAADGALASRPVNHLADETSPYLRQHADNPVEWFPWGDEALRRATRGGQTHLPLHRLRLVPLVPRHGPRELRGPGDGGRPGQVVHLGQGRPRGASRPRFRLHGGHPGPDRVGRLAHVGLLHARRAPLLRRHLLPARGAPRHALVPPGRRRPWATAWVNRARRRSLAQADALVGAVRARGQPGRVAERHRRGDGRRRTVASRRLRTTSTRAP